jgi:DNA polymerase III epsilon subunit-like protein
MSICVLTAMRGRRGVEMLCSKTRHLSTGPSAGTGSRLRQVPQRHFPLAAAAWLPAGRPAAPGSTRGRGRKSRRIYLHTAAECKSEPEPEPAADALEGSRLFLDVPFQHKGAAKSLGARWDKLSKMWYVPEALHCNMQSFDRWRQKAPIQCTPLADADSGSDADADAKSVTAPATATAPATSTATAPATATVPATAPATSNVNANDGHANNDYESPMYDLPPVIRKRPQSGVGNGGADATPRAESAPPAATAVTAHSDSAGAGAGAAEPASQGAVDINGEALVVFYDIETTGLFESSRFRHTPLYHQLKYFAKCRIVQMSYVVCKKSTLEIVDQGDIIIKADNFEIDNGEFHGVTTERSLKEGVRFESAANRFLAACANATHIVAHNADFDVLVTKSELHRYRLKALFEQFSNLKVVCSMKATKDVVKCVNKKGIIKNPRLKELFEFATNETIEGEHNALFDTLNLHMAIRTLIDNKTLDHAVFFDTPPRA